MQSKLASRRGSSQFSRALSSSQVALFQQVQKPIAPTTPNTRVYVPRRDEWRPIPARRQPIAAHPSETRQAETKGREEKQEKLKSLHAKRNEVGVQLLNRRLHEQIFKNTSFPAPPETFVRISQDHLKMHGLDPSQGSVLPDTGFTLPQLQGTTLDTHFYNIGKQAAEPWLSLSQTFAKTELPPPPEHWSLQAGWTKYYHSADGAGCWQSVPYPMTESGAPEEMLSFDVETLPNVSPYAVMACAATQNGWYAWLSPWLLGESDDPAHLIPLGSPATPRVIVGHNVSYDRARLLEEYSVEGTQARFIDTMALHVAVKGISSHQRPAWMKYRKAKRDAQERREESVEAVLDLIRQTEEKLSVEQDPDQQSRLRKLRHDLEESLPLLEAATEDDEAQLPTTEDPSEEPLKRWEDITSANSLADVAKLHCGINVDKAIRNDFMTHTREEILEGVQDYLTYCATDVATTHAVFTSVLPQFLTACPHPVSFAGMLKMGSSFLTVNSEWEHYLKNAERTYRELEDKVRVRLLELTEQAKNMAKDESWKDDVWLNQLDWTPKNVGKSRGYVPMDNIDESVSRPLEEPRYTFVSREIYDQTAPRWFKDVTEQPFLSRTIRLQLPLLMDMTYDGQPLLYDKTAGWHYLSKGRITQLVEGKKTLSVLDKKSLPLLRSGRLAAEPLDLAIAIASGERTEQVRKRIIDLASSVRVSAHDGPDSDSWMGQLDWNLTRLSNGDDPPPKSASKSKKPPKAKQPLPTWPKWYWEMTKPKKGLPPGTPDVTVRNRIAPLLLNLAWRGFPLFHSRGHGWTFRVPRNDTKFETRLRVLDFLEEADTHLRDMSMRENEDGDLVDGDFRFYKLPHKDGEEANVGNPLAKTFIKYAQDGTLTSRGGEAQDALDMNAQCSYWISARDRITKQMVLWQNDKHKLGLQVPDGEKLGVILPQVITMGTVTRRAIEKTWLTASNAKKNRVGSELKAMVRAPPGYALVGADVDSEELWISSVMGDAQFGVHGATAIGWMTLEGTKKAGTDLHSKTASILGISRDQAKVFNYSRIYGAGMKHAVLLLLQSNASMLPEEAQKLADNLYASTKGKNTHRPDLFDHKFWFGGTESFVFNKLEQIALSDKPQTPALGCGITYALSKEYLPEKFGFDYMTSRINWVVQSSGVDYLHLLITSMEYLIQRYGIQARYLISVHDELRYLVKEEDKYRAALALQVSNLWTRSLFAYKLGMDNLPQGVAFFSAVDVDTVLRKEVDMPCITPSQPKAIPFGESLDIIATLAKTNGGSLHSDGRPMETKTRIISSLPRVDTTPKDYAAPDCLAHRSPNAHWLQAQATQDFAELKMLAQKVSGKRYNGGAGWKGGKGKKTKKFAPLASTQSDIEFAEAVEAELARIIASAAHL